MSLSTDPIADANDPEVIPYFPPPRRKGRTAAAVIVAALVIAAAALVAGWWFVANRLEGEIDAFAARLDSDGGHFAAAERKRGGFPFHPTVILTKPELAFPPGAPGPWSWSGDKAEVSVSLFSPRTIDVALSGASRLQASPFGAPLDLAVEAGAATAHLAREPGRETAAISIANLTIATPDGETIQVDQAALRLARALTLPTNERTQAYSAALQLLGLTLPETRTTPLGRRMGQLLVEGVVLGPLPPAFDTSAFRSWRDAGGTVEITRLLARFGPLTISAEATMALDADMQAMGAGTGRIQGFAPALDALAASQAMRLNDANAAKAFLALLARPPMPGAEPQLTAPLTIQERKLFVGPVAVMQMPQIKWPGLTTAAPPAQEPAPAAANPPKPPARDDDPITPSPAPKVLMPEGR
jgi:hypothetical protein